MCPKAYKGSTIHSETTTTTRPQRNTVSSLPSAETASRREPRRSTRAFGLVNGYGEQSCFLNVVLQALWNIGAVREPLLAFARTTEPTDPPFIIEFKVLNP